jgi:hypothetical protein
MGSNFAQVTFLALCFLAWGSHAGSHAADGVRPAVLLSFCF